MTRLSAPMNILSSALLGMVLLGGQPAFAASVSGSYQGTISQDSGLGFFGDIMRVDFTYDDTVLPTTIYNGPNLFSGEYDNFLTSMSVTIGAHVWNWVPAAYGSALFLYDESLISYVRDREDRLVMFVGEFNGPDVSVEGGDFSHSLDMYLSDLGSPGSHDALNTYATLPGVAPNPDLFNDPDNVMSFSFHTGDPETGNYYSIVATNVTQAAPVPEPGTYALLLAGLGLVGMAAKRRAGR